jgi:hypothetical protein
MTSVGATQGIAPETGASFSSGGFSNYFAQPSCTFIPSAKRHPGSNVPFQTSPRR